MKLHHHAAVYFDTAYKLSRTSSHRVLLCMLLVRCFKAKGSNFHFTCKQTQNQSSGITIYRSTSSLSSSTFSERSQIGRNEKEMVELGFYGWLDKVALST